MKLTLNSTENFLDFLKETPTPYHVLGCLEQALKDAGGTETTLTDIRNAERGRLYYIPFADGCIAAFYAGKGFTEQREDVLRIAAAHVDYPVLKIKTTSLKTGANALRLCVESYGGLIRHTWVDRPLKLCGRVFYRTQYGREFADIADLGPRFVIPDVAIHMNPGVNDGARFSVQNQLLPVFGLDTENGTGKFALLLAEKINSIKGFGPSEMITPDDILSIDLSAVVAEDPVVCGADGEFISAQGLDDRGMVHAIFAGFLTYVTESGFASSGDVRVAFAFNHEECGSQSYGGAKTAFAEETVKELCKRFTDRHPLDVCAESMLISADMGHATHPSYPELSDPTSPVVLGGGIVLKTSWNQSYSTTPEAMAFFADLCTRNGIAFQRFTNNSDVRGGGTIGPILSAALGIKTVDVGNPLLSMHASREFETVADQHTAGNLFRAFYE